MFNLIIETLCLLAALFFLRAPATWWRGFVYFLLLSAGTETTGYVLHFMMGQSDNRWLYNLYLFLEITFLFYVLYCVNRGYFKVHFLLVPAFVLFLFVYTKESWSSDWRGYSSLANLIASVTIIVVSCLFYFFLMKQTTHIDISRYPAFWIVSGLFVFYLGSIACTLFDEQLMYLYKSRGLPLRYIIMMVLNFILYGSWSYAFLCKYRQKISSSSSSSSRSSF